MSLSDYADRADALWRDTYARVMALLIRERADVAGPIAAVFADQAVADYARRCATTKPDAEVDRG